MSNRFHAQIGAGEAFVDFNQRGWKRDALKLARYLIACCEVGHEPTSDAKAPHPYRDFCQPAADQDCWRCPHCGHDENWFDRSFSFGADGEMEGPYIRCCKCGMAEDEPVTLSIDGDEIPGSPYAACEE